MKAKLLALCCITMFLSCSKDNNTNINDETKTDYSIEDINNFIKESTSKNRVFDWDLADAKMIFDAGQHSDEIYSVGYTLPNYPQMSEYIGTVETLPQDLIAERENLLSELLKFEQKATGNSNLTIDELLPFGKDNITPSFDIKLTSEEAITYLRNNDNVRYVEPTGYDPNDIVALKSSSGCDGSPDYNINSADYSTTSTYNAKIPWNFDNHSIEDAWDHADGDNISICIIDTGASDGQDNLGSQFTSGNSSSRFINKYSTHYSGMWWWKTLDSPHDQCGHGTSMAGLAAAPWSNDGNALGAAYKANLVTVRAVQDVIISSSNEKNGVKDALILAGNRGDVKIISMSIGNIISSSKVRDGVYYAYNRGKLIFAAAGTSTSFTNWTGVIFPANMNETVAVTGVKAQSSYQRCNTCHSGSKVEFTIEMQRSNNNDRNSLSLASTTNQPKYISGSSCATATTAGIAALVWSEIPSASRSTIINRLKVASELYPNKSSQYGWGNINAEAAVLGQTY